MFEDAEGEISHLEAEVKLESSSLPHDAPKPKKMQLLRLLHERCAQVKNEIKDLLSRHGIKSYR